MNVVYTHTHITHIYIYIFIALETTSKYIHVYTTIYTYYIYLNTIEVYSYLFIVHLNLFFVWFYHTTSTHLEHYLWSLSPSFETSDLTGQYETRHLLFEALVARHGWREDVVPCVDQLRTFRPPTDYHAPDLGLLFGFALGKTGRDSRFLSLKSEHVLLA